MAFQLVMALLVIKWRHGFQAFRWLGDQVTGFLGHVEAGSAFLFGENFFEHEFVFAVSRIIKMIRYVFSTDTHYCRMFFYTDLLLSFRYQTVYRLHGILHCESICLYCLKYFIVKPVVS